MRTHVTTLEIDDLNLGDTGKALERHLAAVRQQVEEQTYGGQGYQPGRQRVTSVQVFPMSVRYSLPATDNSQDFTYTDRGFVIVMTSEDA